MAGYMFDQFAAELVDYMAGGTPVQHCDQDVRYGLELQRERLKEKDLILKYQMTPRGHFAQGGGLSVGWEDDCYSSHMEYRTRTVRRTFYKDKKKIFDKDQDCLFYQTITDFKYSGMSGEESFTCPNCGAISKIKDLQNGCGYCGTYFQMSDLFPTVTNYYFVRDVGGTPEEVKGSVMKTVIPAVAVCCGIVLLSYLFAPPSGLGEILSMIFGLLAAAVLGGIFGYMIWAIRMLGIVFFEAAKSIPMLFNFAGSRKRFVNFMKQHSPNFSYDYFAGKVVANLKMILFSEDPQILPNYQGGPIQSRCRNIVDVANGGAVALKHMRVQDRWCHVTVDVYLETFSERNGKIGKRSEKFWMGLKKDLSQPMNFHFSIKKVQCKSCGGSFDATKMKCCPHCGNEYAVTDEDWIVEYIR